MKSGSSVHPRRIARRPAMLAILLLGVAAGSTLRAAINSSYVGPDMGSWSDAANWSPAQVPDNDGKIKFNVTVDQDVAVQLDIDAAIKHLTLGAESAQLLVTDHTLRVTRSTSMGPANRLDVVAQDAATAFGDIGTLTNFSGTEFLSGGLFVTAAPGTKARLQFKGANIVTNSGRLGLIGAGASITDQTGANALANFTTNAAGGFIRFARGYDFTTDKDFTNDGYLVVRAGTTATFNGGFVDVIGKGDDDGLIEVFGTDDPSAGVDGGNGRLIVNGAFSSYNAATHTLTDGQYGPTTYGGASGTIQFNDADIVINNAFLLINGPKAGIADQNGNDGLRNIAVNNGILEFDRQTRTTTGDFTNNGTGDAGGFYLSGDTHFTVAGSLTNNGFFLLSAYNNAQGIAIPGFPDSQPEAFPADATVQGSLTLASQGEMDFDLYSAAIGGVIHVGGPATLGGTLTLTFMYDDDSHLLPGDVLTLIDAAGGIGGAFANVASGGRLDVATAGQTSGSFLVTYGGKTLTLSDYQALPVVTLTAPVRKVKAGTGQAGEFQLTRAGDLSKEVVVAYTVSGDAVAGTDYVALSGTKRLKAGQAKAAIQVMPLGNGRGPGVSRTVKLKLAPGDGYAVGTTERVKVEIIGR